MGSLKDKIDLNKLPEHIAIIMDGNGRWAKQHNRPRVFGHKNGVKAVREATEACAEIGVKYLTLYAFSTENWNRPLLEVNALMGLLVDTLTKEIKTLNDNNIRLKAIGAIDQLPTKTHKALLEGIQNTANNNRMTLVLALNYSGKWDIIQATKQLMQDFPGMDPALLTEHMVAERLSTAGMPDPELLIRTSGENRISNFLLWQLAYSEMVFLDAFWPEFTKEHLYESIFLFQQRERRFGKTSEQLHTP